MFRAAGLHEGPNNVDASIEAFQTLVTLKKEAIAALHEEYIYAEKEYDSIDSFNRLCQALEPKVSHSQSGTGRSTGGSRLDSIRSQDGEAQEASSQHKALLKWQSPEFNKREMRWRTQLNQSLECITAQIARDRKATVTIAEVDAIAESISQLQNAYFQAVEDREKNSRLWLRLKMYSANRRDTLDKALQPFGVLRSMLNAREHQEMRFEGAHVAQTRGAQDYQAGDNNAPQKATDRDTGVTDTDPFVRSDNLSKYENLERRLNETSSVVREHSYANPSIAEFLDQMKSTTQFYAMTRNIYIQYGDGSMSYKVFNNIIDFLLRSLGISSIDKLAVKKLLKAYGVGTASCINFNTFVILYWEIAHVIKSALDTMDPIGLHATHNRNMALQQVEEPSYVDIEDLLLFKKKLNSGDACTKYLAVELKTGRPRVVDVITKGPRVPKFEQISMEIARLSKLQNHHLALYLAAYHDLNSVYVVSEYCEYGSLLTHLQIKRDTVYTIGFIHLVFTQLIEALLYIHCNNLVHGSLSIDKIMIPDCEYNRVKIRDLGLRGLLDNEVQGSALTFMHMAPEALEGRLCHKSDIWAAGVILTFLVTGVMPLERTEYCDYTRAVERALVSGKVFPRDDELSDLVRKMISPDPCSRPTAFDIITHPWYTRSIAMESTPGQFKLMVQPLNSLLKTKRMQFDVLRVLESQNMLHLTKVRKLKETVQLLRKLTDDRLMVRDLRRLLHLEGLNTQIINNILVVIAFDEEEVRAEEFLNTLSLWRSGELALVWNAYKTRADGPGYSMRSMEFARFLSDLETRLISREEITRICNALAVDDQIYWADFASFFY